MADEALIAAKTIEFDEFQPGLVPRQRIEERDRGVQQHRIPKPLTPEIHLCQRVYIVPSCPAPRLSEPKAEASDAHHDGLAIRRTIFDDRTTPVPHEPEINVGSIGVHV